MRHLSLGRTLLVGLAAAVAVWVSSADAATTGRRSLLQSDMDTLTGAMRCVPGACGPGIPPLARVLLGPCGGAVVNSVSATKTLALSKPCHPPYPAGTAVIISITSLQRLQGDRQASWAVCGVCWCASGGGVQYRCCAAAP
jgi:hypothetical protein